MSKAVTISIRMNTEAYNKYHDEFQDKPIGCYYCRYCDISNSHRGTHRGTVCMKLDKVTIYCKVSVLRDCTYTEELQ